MKTTSSLWTSDFPEPFPSEALSSITPCISGLLQYKPGLRVHVGLLLDGGACFPTIYLLI